MNSVCELASPRKLQWKVFPEITDAIIASSEDLDRYMITP
jgi:hypothetical protein